MAVFANQWQTKRKIAKRRKHLDFSSWWFQECSYIFDVAWWGRNGQNCDSDERTHLEAFRKWHATNWLVKEYFQAGNRIFKIKDVRTWLQHASSIQRGFLFVSIEAQNENYNVLSGKYNFHSLRNNKPAFIREGGYVPGVIGQNFYLVYCGGKINAWHIQSDGWFLGGNAGGFFRIYTSGKSLQSVYIFYLLLFITSSKIHRILRNCEYWLCTLETNPLFLASIWKEADDSNSWSLTATIKIFDEKERFNEYQKTLKKWFF